jgi:hypothetical protein
MARDMRAAGAEVHVADSSGAMISRWSCAVDAFHRLRPPVQDPRGFRSDVADLVARISPALVVPTCEEVFHLAAARDDGVAVGHLFAPDADTLDTLHAKDRFNELACGLGLSAPETRLLTGSFDAEALDLPRTVLKACYSRFGVGTLVAPTLAQASGIAPSTSAPWIAQRLVHGIEHSSYAIAVEGAVTAFAAYRSTMRLAGGAGYAFQAADGNVSTRMLEATARIAEDLGLTGQISLDAIDDGDHAWLIECNPRATSGIHLLAGDGGLARAMAGIGSPVTCNGGARHNLPMVLTSPSGLELALSRESRDVIGAPGDRMPVLGAILDSAAFAFDALRHGLGVTGATTRDIEWNGARS